MVRSLARLLGLVIGASLLAGIVSALAAVGYKKKTPPRPHAAADQIDLVVVMDGARLASTAASFRGGRVICWYAGVDLDLRDATFDPAGADLEVRTVFGGTRIVVAPGVPVAASGPAIFGGRTTETNGHAVDAARPGLRVTGFTLFGGLQVLVAEPGEAIEAWAAEPAPGLPPEPAPEPTPEPA